MKSRAICALAATLMLTAVGTNSVSAASQIGNVTNVDKQINLTEEKLDKITPWQHNTKYSVGEKVEYKGKVYVCIVDHSRLSPLTRYVWNEVIIPEWKMDTKYFVGDKVMYQGKVYVCIVDHSRLSPLTNYVWKSIL